MERDNIIIGAAKFWISDPAAPTGSDFTNPEPDIPEGTGAVTLTNWRELGFTTEGVEVSYEPDYADVEVDQLLDSAVIFKQGMRVTVNTTLAEATFENLIVAWGQADASITATAAPGTNGRLAISSGQLGDFPIERSLLFQGPAPRGGTTLQRWYYLGRAIQTESTAFALRRAEATTLPASFRCLPDETGEYGAIIDRARTGT